MKKTIINIKLACTDLIALFKFYSGALNILNISLCLFICSCSAFIPGPEGSPNKTYKVNFNNSDWSAIGPDSSDHAFVSTKTKSTIVAQSFCKKFQTASLETLSSTIFNGIDDLVVIEKNDLSIASREALRTLAHGTIDGVKVFLNLVSVQKDLCLFDFVLISTSLDNMKKDSTVFEEFLKGLSL